MCHSDSITKLENALNGAISVATKRNIPPLKGCTLLLVAGGYQMKVAKMAGKSKKITSALDVALLLSQMCKASCENVKYVLFRAGCIQEKLDNLDKSGNLLDNVKQLSEELSHHVYSMYCLDKLVNDYLMDFLRHEVRFDNVVLVHGGFFESKTPFMNWLDQYRVLVNPNMIFADIDVLGKSGELPIILQ